MPLASSNRVGLRYIPEVTFGTTPSTPAFQALRFNSESLNYNLSNVVSEEIRQDRQTSDLVQVQSDASGDVNFEFSAAAFDDLIEGAMAADWAASVAISATDIAVVGDQFTSGATNFVTEGIVVGQWIQVSGFTTAANNGYFRVAAVAAGAITVAQTGVLQAEAAGDTVVISGTMIRNGTALKSYSIQKELADLTNPVFFLYRGARIGSMNLNFETGSILTGSFNIMALGCRSGTVGEAGQTIVAAPTNDVMNAVSNVVGIEIDDVVSTAFFNTLSLQVNNNLRAQDAIGSLEHIGIALSRLEVTGDVELYFEDESQYTKYLNATSFSLSFRVQDSAGNAYQFTLPRCKYETGEVVAGGLDQDVMQRSRLRAILDPTTNCTVQIDRF